MESKQNRALKEFDSLYKMIDDVYHEIALSMDLTDSAFLILYCLLELGDGCSQKDICKLYSISKQTVNYVTLPGMIGSFSILPGHAPIVSSLKAGTLSYTTMEGEIGRAHV